MGLFGVDYGAGADVLDRLTLYQLLAPCVPGIRLDDMAKSSYLLLDQGLGRQFVQANVTVFNELVYGGNLKTKDEEYPNCEDFSVAAYGELTSSWLRHGGQHALAAGLLTLTPKWAPAARHEEILHVWKGGVKEVYEPQTGGFKAWDDEVLAAYGARMG